MAGVVPPLTNIVMDIRFNHVLIGDLTILLHLSLMLWVLFNLRSSCSSGGCSSSDNSARRSARLQCSVGRVLPPTGSVLRPRRPSGDGSCTPGSAGTLPLKHFAFCSLQMCMCTVFVPPFFSNIYFHRFSRFPDESSIQHLTKHFPPQTGFFYLFSFLFIFFFYFGRVLHKCFCS